MFVVDLLPIELVLGFNRGLEVIEEDMDELFSHRNRTAQCQNQCLFISPFILQSDPGSIPCRLVCMKFMTTYGFLINGSFLDIACHPIAHQLPPLPVLQQYLAGAIRAKR